MSSGEVTQTLDYYPYGSQRIATGSFSEQRRFIGEEFDGDTEFSYLNARYYQGSRGQFMSQDPVFLAVGDPMRARQIAARELIEILADPQLLNSYAYARDNPIGSRDPQGTCPMCPFIVAGGLGAIGGIGVQAFNDFYSGDFSNRTWQQNLSSYGVAAVSGATVSVGTLGAGVVALGAGFSAGATTLFVAGTAGTLTGGTMVAGNRVLGQPTNPTDVIVSSGISTLSAGTLRTLPRVPGRLPNFNTQAFYTGAHTARQAAEEFIANSMQILGKTAVTAGAPAGSGGGVDVWAIVKSAFSQYYAEGGK